MEKIAIVLACLTLACDGRRVHTDLSPTMVGAPRVSPQVHRQARSSPVVAQAQWFEGSSGGLGGAPLDMPGSAWDINAISQGGRLVKRIEGRTRKTWNFDDISKDRVSVAVGSEGRPVHA